MTLNKNVSGDFNPNAQTRTTLQIDCTDLHGVDLLVSLDGEKGPLLQALEGNRPICLDNLSKLKPGTDTVLAPVVSFINGETDTLDVYDRIRGTEQIGHYTRDDIGDRFLLTVRDMPSAADDLQISPSLLARLGPMVQATTAPTAKAPQKPKL